MRDEEASVEEDEEEPSSSSSSSPVVMSRRDTLVRATAAAAAGLTASSSSSRAEAASTFVKDPAFYGEWSYSQPSDIVPYVKATAKQGDAVGVLRAMDIFGEYYPMYKLGDEKGQILARLVRDRAPVHSLEVGTFLGYSAIWTAINLPPGAHLICVEFEPRHVEVARALTTYAGVSDRVQILQGAGSERIPDVVKLIGEGKPADMIFLDHCKECYLPDLRLMEDAGLVGAGTVVVADNVVYPGAPDFLEWVDTSRGAYKTELIDAMFEYDQVWKKDWVPQKDALSFSTYIGGGPEGGGREGYTGVSETVRQ